ncbi:hypothetical protein M9H77_18481 [Catharanthus roseus]|uniref:Uncharacterized protein n=1 Tax=Catharanthus roseus TaxID=4058 RepID=A0ACC0B7L5_CATRO|nr:hypothetical protein M9H77_18481 [Catharanthus roseus]
MSTPMAHHGSISQIWLPSHLKEGRNAYRKHERWMPSEVRNLKWGHRNKFRHPVVNTSLNSKAHCTNVRFFNLTQHIHKQVLDQISIGPISKVREMRRIIKGVLSSVLHEDPGATLTTPLEMQKIGKSSGSGSDSGSSSDSGSGSRGKGRLPRAPRGWGRGCSSGRSRLSSVIDPSTPFSFPYIDTFLGFVYPFIETRRV